MQNVTTPLLIQHGENDYRVPLSQAQEFYKALKTLHKTVEFDIYPRGGHVNFEPPLEREYMRRNLEWFEKWLGRDWRSGTEPIGEETMKIRLTLLSLLLIGVVSIAPSAHAQTFTSTLEGTVTDRTGSRLARRDNSCQRRDGRSRREYRFPGLLSRRRAAPGELHGDCLALRFLYESP